MNKYYVYVINSQRDYENKKFKDKNPDYVEGNHVYVGQSVHEPKVF